MVYYRLQLYVYVYIYVYVYVYTYKRSVMHGVPFRRALTPVYKGEITPPAIPVFSELD